MSAFFMLLPVLIPCAAACLMGARPLRDKKPRRIFVLTAVLLTSAAVLLLVLFPPAGRLPLLTLFERARLEFAADGMSRIFLCIIALLWPPTTLYAFDYMEHEENKNRFFAFFLLSYGITAGIALAGNLLTLYLFFELLTLATMPLVMHEGDDRARFAGKRYLLFSMSGAALGFIAVVFISACGSAPMAFALGGVLDPEKIAGHETLLRTVFTIAFFGFGVKAALLPMSAWLPAASVAPTPVTALLHAVAVVKAGAFACIRLTYYSFGTELLSGTFAQYIPQAAAAATVVAGSFLALRQNHLKRRLAWSTVSNLSYILIGVTAMTPAGLAAGTMHMVYHAFVKITLFFCVGAVMVKTGNDYLDQIEGLAKRMPVTFACFTVAGLALIGLPPLPGFFSKWLLGTAAAALDTPLGYISMGALIVSATLTALYIITPITSACFPIGGHSADMYGPSHETRLMGTPIVVLTVCIVLLGLFSGTVYGIITGWLM